MAEGSLVVHTAIVYPSNVDQGLLTNLYTRVNNNPADLAWMFASQPGLKRAYGNPGVAAMDVTVQVTPWGNRDCAPRPAAVVYLPAAVRTRSFTAVLQFDAPFSNLTNATVCGPTYSCVLGAGVRAAVRAGSAVALTPDATTWAVTLDTYGAGEVSLVLREDTCNPRSLPVFLQLTADFSPPTAKLTLSRQPSLSTSQFSVLVTFSEAVLPLLPSHVTVTGASVESVVTTNTTTSGDSATALIVLQGQPGQTATVQLLGLSYTDVAGNAGLPSNELSVSVPTHVLTGSALILNIASAAAVGAAGLSCAAGAVLTPGWTAVACGAGVLRSVGHLQILAMTRHLAAALPPSYTAATGAATWSLLEFLPDGVTSWADEQSRALPALDAAQAALVPAPPAAVSVLDQALMNLTANACPVLVAASTQPSDLPLSSFAVAQLTWQADVPADTAGVVHSSWHDMMSAVQLATIFLIGAVLAHAVIAWWFDQSLRLAGVQVYIAFPKVLSLTAAAVLPASLHAVTRVASLETAYASVPILPAGLWLACVLGGAVLYGCLVWVAAVQAPRYLVVEPVDDGPWGTDPTARLTPEQHTALASYLAGVLPGRGSNRVAPDPPAPGGMPGLGGPRASVSIPAQQPNPGLPGLRASSSLPQPGLVPLAMLPVENDPRLRGHSSVVYPGLPVPQRLPSPGPGFYSPGPGGSPGPLGAAQGSRQYSPGMPPPLPGAPAPPQPAPPPPAGRLRSAVSQPDPHAQRGEPQPEPVAEGSLSVRSSAAMPVASATHTSPDSPHAARQLRVAVPGTSGLFSNKSSPGAVMTEPNTATATGHAQPSWGPGSTADPFIAMPSDRPAASGASTPGRLSSRASGPEYNPAVGWRPRRPSEIVPDDDESEEGSPGQPVGEAAEGFPPGGADTVDPHSGTYRLRMSRVREALRVGNTRAVAVMPDPEVLLQRQERQRQRREERRRMHEATTAAAAGATGGPSLAAGPHAAHRGYGGWMTAGVGAPGTVFNAQRARRAGGGGNGGGAPTVTAEDGRQVLTAPAHAKSAWCCRHGWLVEDIVGNPGAEEPQTSVADRCHWRWLIANALSVLHVGVMAGLMGAWAADSHSTLQLSVVLGVKAVFTQYVIALRSYGSLAALLPEVSLSLCECGVLVFLMLHHLKAAVGVPSSTVALLIVMIEVACITGLEVGRVLVQGSAMLSRVRGPRRKVVPAPA